MGIPCNLTLTQFAKVVLKEDAHITRVLGIGNLVPRALFCGFGGGVGKAREKRPEDEVGKCGYPKLGDAHIIVTSSIILIRWIVIYSDSVDSAYPKFE